MACYVAASSKNIAPLPREGFSKLEGETDEYTEARHAAYQSCASELREAVDSILDRLNKPEFERISDFLSSATVQLQHRWKSDQDEELTPPYSVVPAALVHTGCSIADLEFTMQQLLRSLRANCSPHVALLRSKDCTTLATAVRSLVSQLVTPTAHCAPTCTYDLSVLAGWYEDLQAGRVAANARPSRAGAHEPALSGAGQRGGAHQSRTTVLPVVIEDVEHIDREVISPVRSVVAVVVGVHDQL